MKNSATNTFSVLNGLDADQDRHNVGPGLNGLNSDQDRHCVGPDLDHNCFQRLSADSQLAIGRMFNCL